MSKNNESSYLVFPWNGQIPAGETVTLRDLDVIGVGAKRRKQIEALQGAKQIILQTHEAFIPDGVRSIYDDELFRSLQWLRPLRIDKISEFNLLDEQKKIFQRVFPKTAQTLGLAAAKVRDSYLAEMEWSSWLLQDHWRYFVGYLRQRFPQQKELVDLAYWEWVQAWLEVQPFDLHTNLEKGILTVNPSLQIVPLLENNSILGKMKGMYAFVYSEKQEQVLEKPLTAAQALLLDLLQEDRKFSTEQLVEMASISEELQPNLNKTQWAEVVTDMLNSEILFQN
ncbi:hypothetical protein [Bdellovibrio sp. NC01]|uniref:hypothetical protein n=1 Tax=Bdellovibrio sp. NC01 TaxID=2220073 RepID=UPI001158BC60|nr:hypothetical protein [Bdellovibrio sp. NC01]QDK37639.1 hypothetical protein DOE51_08620 [Bdellovibrio sp. NC01]